MTVDTLPLDMQDALISRCRKCGMQVIPTIVGINATCPNKFCATVTALRDYLQVSSG